MVVGTVSLVQKGQTSGCTGCSKQRTNHYLPLFHCIHCVNWFDLFAPKTMSPPPYTTIPLHPLQTVTTILLHSLHNAFTGLTFLYQRQCPHHHIPLLHCILGLVCTASTASSGLNFLHQRQCPHHHISLFHCVHCILHPLV